MWCFPIAGSYRRRLREVYNSYGRHKSMAKKLKTHIDKNFTKEQQYGEFVAAMNIETKHNEEVEELFEQLQQQGN